MPFLTAALVLIGVLLAVDLILTLGVIRRLREHAELIAKALQHGAAVEKTMLPVGSPLPELSARTVSGAVAPDSGPLLIGFFSSGCPSCALYLPGFVEYAEAFAGRVLAVAVGAPEEVREIVADLLPVADVVIEPYDGPLATLLQVRGLPAMATVDTDGIVTATGYRATDLPSLATV